MGKIIDHREVSLDGLSHLPVGSALAGLRAHEARYFFKNHQKEFAVSPANESTHLIEWVDDLLARERQIVIDAQPVELAFVQLESIDWVFVFYESGLAINVLFSHSRAEKRAVGFKLSEGMEIPDELASKFKFVRQKSTLAGTIRGSYFMVKGEFDLPSGLNKDT